MASRKDVSNGMEVIMQAVAEMGFTDATHALLEALENVSHHIDIISICDRF